MCVDAGRDSLTGLSTGGRISLLLQAPAEVLPGSAVVVLSLIEIKKNQVDGARRFMILYAAQSQ